MEDIFDIITTAIIVISLKTNEIKNVNKAAIELFGYQNSNDLLGEDFHILLPPNHVEFHKKLMARNSNYYRVTSMSRKITIYDLSNIAKVVLITIDIDDDRAIAQLIPLNDMLINHTKKIQKSLTQFILKDIE